LGYDTLIELISHQRILIVDDESSLLELMRRYLVAQGFDVEVRLTGTSALEAVEAGPPFDLAVIDITLPDVKGDTVARALLERYPHMRVLIYSGYPYDVAALPKAIRNRASFLQKPFLPNMLAQEIANLMPGH
jgi:DNA-binding NtrC family response regulator